MLVRDWLALMEGQRYHWSVGVVGKLTVAVGTNVREMRWRERDGEG